MSPISKGLRSRWSALPLRDRKMLGIMVGAIVLFCLMQWAVLPVLDGLSEEESRGGAEEELARMKGWIEATPALERETRGLEALAAAQQARLLPATSPQLASAALQKAVEQQAARQEVEIRSVQMGEPKATEGRFMRIPMSLDMNGPLAKLMALLHALESGGKPSLVVEKLEFRRGNAQTPDDYLMRLEVYALHEPDIQHKKSEKSAN